MANPPWQCGHCRKTAKASANNCSHCRASWKNANPNFVPPTRGQSRRQHQAQQGEWESNNWGYTNNYGTSPRGSPNDSSWKQRPKSPRKGRYHHGQKSKHHGAQSRSQPGKGKNQEASYGADGFIATPNTAKGLPPEPRWKPSLPSMPALPPLPPPTSPHPDSQAVQTLNKLTAVIKKKPGRYDAEVHAILQGAAMAEGLNAKDQMLKAAEDLGTARRAIDAARLGRYQNHVLWRDFLTSAAARCSTCEYA